MVSTVLIILLMCFGTVVIAVLYFLLNRLLFGEKMYPAGADRIAWRFAELMRTQASGIDTATRETPKDLAGLLDEEDFLRICSDILAAQALPVESRCFCASILAQAGRKDVVSEDMLRQLLSSRQTPKSVLASTLEMALRLGIDIDPRVLRRVERIAGDDPASKALLQKASQATTGVAAGSDTPSRDQR